MKFSDSVESLLPALIEVQGTMTTPKKSREGRTGNQVYKYADLSDIMEIVQPLFFKHDLFISHPFETGDNWIKVSTLLRHKSGEWVESGSLVLKGNVSNEKEQGKLLTYGKRYSLCALMGIAADEDTDGRQTEEPPDQNKYESIKGNKQGKATTKPTPKSEPEQPVAKMTEKTLLGIKNLWISYHLAPEKINVQTNKLYKLPLYELTEEQGKEFLEKLKASQTADTKPSNVTELKGKMSTEQRNKIFKIGGDKGLSSDDVKKVAYTYTKLDSMTKMTKQQAHDVINFIENSTPEELQQYIQTDAMKGAV